MKKKQSTEKPKLPKPKPKRSEPRLDYHEVMDYIEKKYKIDTRGYTPKCGFTEEQLEEAKRYGGDRVPYLDFWHYLMDHNEINNPCYVYLNLLGDYEEGKSEDDGDWDGDSKYRPRWVREIQKMLYDEFKPEDGELVCWVEW